MYNIKINKYQLENESKLGQYLEPGFTRIMASRSGIAVGLNHGHVVTSIPRAAKPVDRKGVSHLFSSSFILCT